MAACTLERKRSVWRAWKEISEPAPKSIPFAIAMALQDHPNRAELVNKNLNITRAEARRLARDHRKGDDKAKPAASKDGSAPRSDKTKADTETVSKRQGALLVAANKATSAAREIHQWLKDGRELTAAMETAFAEFVEQATLLAPVWEAWVTRRLTRAADAPALSPDKPKSVH